MINRNARTNKIIKVVDSLTVLIVCIIFFGAFFLVGILGICCTIGEFLTGAKSIDIEFLATSCADTLGFMPFFIYPFARFIVAKKGYIIDNEERTFTFPGVGFIWSRLKRYTINLDEIREIKIFEDEYKSMNRHTIMINGDFGEYTFKFYSRGKCRQLYATLVAVCDM